VRLPRRRPEGARCAFTVTPSSDSPGAGSSCSRLQTDARFGQRRRPSTFRRRPRTVGGVAGDKRARASNEAFPVFLIEPQQIRQRTLAVTDGDEGAFTYQSSSLGGGSMSVIAETSSRSNTFRGQRRTTEAEPSRPRPRGQHRGQHRTCFRGEPVTPESRNHAGFPARVQS
jgi:hypothetical protein